MKGMYQSARERLVKTIEEPTNEQACWIGKKGTRCRFGYVRLNFWIPGLGKSVKLTSHVLMWVALEVESQSIDDLFLAYLEFRYSGLTIDHLCHCAACRNPDHLEPKIFVDNIHNQQRFRRHGQAGIPGIAR